jgi:hypothetical protein
MNGSKSRGYNFRIKEPTAVSYLTLRRRRITIPSIPEPARIINPVEGSEPSVPRKAGLAKLMRPSKRLANQNIRYFRNPSGFPVLDLSKGCIIIPFNLGKISRRLETGQLRSCTGLTFNEPVSIERRISQQADCGNVI